MAKRTRNVCITKYTRLYINRVFPLPQGIHVAKFGQGPKYRTKVIVCKRSCCQKFYL